MNHVEAEIWKATLRLRPSQVEPRRPSASIEQQKIFILQFSNFYLSFYDKVIYNIYTAIWLTVSVPSYVTVEADDGDDDDKSH